MTDIYREAEIRAIRRVLAENKVTFQSRAVIYRDRIDAFYEALANELIDTLDECREGAA